MRLNEYREIVKVIQNQDSARIPDVELLFVEGLPKPLPRGARVSAFSPKSNFVHEAMVTSYTSTGYNVKFFHEDLGTCALPHELVMVSDVFLR